MPRWGSTYDMLSSLLRLQTFCANCVAHGNDRMKLSNETWEKITEIKLSLEPFYRATIQLQKEDLPLTDVYKIINICHMSTAEIGNLFFKHRHLGLLESLR